MTVRRRFVGGAALGAALFSAIATAEAQNANSWVDPPAQATAPKADAAPAPAAAAPAPAAPQANAAAPARSAVEPKAPAEAKPQRRLARTKPARQEAARRPAPRRLAETSRIPAPRRAPAGRTASSDRLELMVLRTIEYPDGRRVQVLVPPETSSGF